MKLVFVNDLIYEYASGSPRRVGGAERQQWILARALVSLGWSVTIGVRHALQASKCENIDGVNFVGIGSGIYLWACYRFLLSERPDWWYWRAAEHWWGPAVQIAKMAKVRTIYAAAFDTDVIPRRALARRKRWWPLYAWGLMCSDRIFVQHEGQLSRLAPQWQSKAFIVPSFSGEISMSTPHEQRREYVAWVANLRRPKRADLLIEIAKKIPAIQFVVCGGLTSHRSSREYGQKIVAGLCALPNVEYLGLVDPQKAKQIIAEASMFLSTSDSEGFPNTFLEAWSSGTPVVSLTIDPDGIIQHKGLGRVTGTFEQASKDIEILMADPKLRDQIGRHAKGYISERHSLEGVTKIFLEAISHECRG